MYLLPYLILLVWLKTNALVEWCNFLRLTFLNKTFKQYKEISNAGGEVEWVNLFKKSYPHNFLVKLLTCDICLCVWLSIGVCFWGYSFYYLPVIFAANILLYRITVKLI